MSVWMDGWDLLRDDGRMILNASGEVSSSQTPRPSPLNAGERPADEASPGAGDASAAAPARAGVPSHDGLDRVVHGGGGHHPTTGLAAPARSEVLAHHHGGVLGPGPGAAVHVFHA